MFHNWPAIVYSQEPLQPSYFLPLNDWRGEGDCVRSQLGGEDVWLFGGPTLGGREDEEGGVTLVLYSNLFAARLQYNTT